MATATKLVATARDRAGKGMARETRRQNRIPCVIYGGKLPPQMISIEAKLLERDVQTSSFVTRTYQIEVDGKSHNVLPRDVQFHPVSDKPLHIDFLRIDATSVVTVSVPFDFANPEASPGIKKGGVLNIVHHEIELRCRPDQIPAHITIDLTGMEVGSSVHLKDIVLPQGVTTVSHEQDYTIATVASPSAMRGKEEEADAAPTGADAAKPPAPEAPAAS